MRIPTTAMIGLSALAFAACQTGAEGLQRMGSGGTIAVGTGGAGTGGTVDPPPNGGSGGGVTATGGNADTGGAAGLADGGAAGSGGTGSGGTDGSAGATGTGGAGTGGSVATGTGGMAGAGGTTPALKQGPFKILVLSTALVFPHDSIPTCLTMLRDLGKANAPERGRIAGLAADSTWTVDQIGSDPDSPNYFSEVSADNLKNYEMFYSNNPTGPVFSDAPNGAQKKQIFVDYWNGGGSWAGQHSATDFEKFGSWTWFQDNIDGAYFTDHDQQGTPGTVVWQPEFVNHPILKGLTSPWSVSDEWYVVNRNVEAVPGFKVLAKVTVTNSAKGTSPRPAVWIRDNPNGKGGRSFYTIRGHEPKTYAESQFRELMLRGILWSVHRLPGGN